MFDSYFLFCFSLFVINVAECASGSQFHYRQRQSLKDHGPCCTGARYSQDDVSAFGRLVVPIATPGLHNPDAGSSLDPLADQYALERGLLRPTAIILATSLRVKSIAGFVSKQNEGSKQR